MQKLQGLVERKVLPKLQPGRHCGGVSLCRRGRPSECDRGIRSHRERDLIRCPDLEVRVRRASEEKRKRGQKEGMKRKRRGRGKGEGGNIHYYH